MSKTKDQCEITKVTIRIGNRDHVVTIEQAKALKEALESLFGKVVEEHHHHHDRYLYKWSAPKFTCELKGSNATLCVQ